MILDQVSFPLMKIFNSNLILAEFSLDFNILNNVDVICCSSCAYRLILMYETVIHVAGFPILVEIPPKLHLL